MMCLREIIESLEKNKFQILLFSPQLIILCDEDLCSSLHAVEISQTNKQTKLISLVMHENYTYLGYKDKY